MAEMRFPAPIPASQLKSGKGASKTPRPIKEGRKARPRKNAGAKKGAKGHG